MSVVQKLKSVEACPESQYNFITIPTAMYSLLSSDFRAETQVSVHVHRRAPRLTATQSSRLSLISTLNMSYKVK